MALGGGRPSPRTIVWSEGGFGHPKRGDLVWPKSTPMGWLGVAATTPVTAVSGQAPIGVVDYYTFNQFYFIFLIVVLEKLEIIWTFW
jgi:hypothetical protein